MQLPRLYILYRPRITVMYNVSKNLFPIIRQRSFVYTFIPDYLYYYTGVTPLAQAVMHLFDLIFLYGRTERYNSRSSAARHEWLSAGYFPGFSKHYNFINLI